MPVRVRGGGRLLFNKIVLNTSAVSSDGRFSSSQLRLFGDGQGKTSVGQRCHIGRYRLKRSSLASVKVNYWKIAVGQGIKVPSPDIFALQACVILRLRACLLFTDVFLFKDILVLVRGQ